MNKTEIVRNLNDSEPALAIVQSVQELQRTIQQLPNDSAAAVEKIARLLEPLAIAMASLSDETRETLSGIERRSQKQSEQLNNQMVSAAKTWKDAAAEAQRATDRLSRSCPKIEWRYFLLAALIGMLSAGLVTVFWLWLALPLSSPNQVQLDPQAVAKYLQPAIIEALKPFKGK